MQVRIIPVGTAGSTRESLASAGWRPSQGPSGKQCREYVYLWQYVRPSPGFGIQQTRVQVPSLLCPRVVDGGGGGATMEEANRCF